MVLKIVMIAKLYVQELKEEVEAQRTAIEQLLEEAELISEKMGESRLSSSSTQLQQRYLALNENITVRDFDILTSFSYFMIR